MRRFDNKAIALIAVIIIILLITITVLGITSFISNSLSLNVAKSSLEGAVSAAKAGIYAAIYDYIASPGQPYWDRASDVKIDGNIYYSVGGKGETRRMSNFLLIDADNPQTVNSGGGGTNNQLQRIPLSNINPTQSITVNQMRVEWMNFGGALNRITLAGV